MSDPPGKPPSFFTPKKVHPVERIDDLEAYRQLHRIIELLTDLSKRCWSFQAATAIQVAAEVLRAVASGLARAAGCDRG